MPNEYFDPGEQRASKVKALFERIARRYDLLNDLQSFGLHRYWKRQVIELARPRPGQRSLDLCCGTGDLTLRLAGRGQAVGLDFSEGMLRIAEKRKQKFAGENVGRTSEQQRTNRAPTEKAPRVPNYIRGDAQRIPFVEASFDIV